MKDLDKKKIMDKVIKLLTLADGTDHTPEADSARAMAADLMAKYEIKAIEQKLEHSEEREVLTRIKPIKYDSALIQIVTSFNGVGYIVKQTHDRGENVYVGFKPDIIGARYMINILMEQRLTAWKGYLKQYREECGKAPKEKEKVAWMMGFAFGVWDKMNELTAMKEDKIQEYGLVPVDNRENALNEYRKNNATTQSKGRSIGYSEAGRKAGKEAHIHKGIGKKSSVALIG
jgi:hypothetical protein